MSPESIFKKLAANNKLSHAYLLWGYPDITLVRCLANFLENQKWEESTGPLIDFLEVSPEQSIVGKETTGIAAVKSAQKFLWQKPIASERRLLVINRAEKLTAEARNAVLKIAEEPPPRTLLIVLVSDPELLTAPLISRFQKIYCARKQPKSGELANSGETANIFLRADIRGKNDIIKEMINDSQRLEKFVGAVMAELAREPIKNWKPLKELCRRWELIGRYNTNKRLQLEAWLESFRG